MLAERRQRIEKDKQEKEVAEKVKREAEAEARRRAIHADPNSAKAKQASYAQQQRKRNQEARLERERIIRNIESDKAERKEKEELQKAQANAAIETDGGVKFLVDGKLSRKESQVRSRSDEECALQVRLLDGSTVRRRYPASETLSDARTWIDQTSDGSRPYTFKQIIVPKPNRAFSIAEEKESFQSLGLTPSSTIVMVPVQGYTAAYPMNHGALYRTLLAIYHWLRLGAGAIISVFLVFFRTGRMSTPESGQDTTQEPLGERNATGNGPHIKVRTLHDQREDDRSDHQLYNGNQVSNYNLLNDLL